MSPKFQPRRPSERAPLALVAVAVLSVAIWIARADMARVVAVLADGSGYYLQLARNEARGLGATFDGIHPTDGYHPLWLWVLSFVFRFVHASSETLVRVVGVLAAVGLGVGALWFHRALRLMISAPAALVALIAYLAVALSLFNLMETSILLVCFSALFWIGHRHRERRHWTTALAFGLCLGVTVLARLDSALLAVAVGVAYLVAIARHRGEARVRAAAHAALVGVGAAVVLAPYFVHGWLRFGTFMPVSGRLESLFPHTNLPHLRETLREFGRGRLVIALLVSVALVIEGWRRYNDRSASGERRYLHDALLVASSAYVVHLMHELVFMRWQLYWHHALLVPLSAALVGLMWESRTRVEAHRPMRTATAVTAIAFIVIGLASTAQRLRAARADGWRQRAYRVALWLRRETPPNARVAMRVAEITGFFSERATVDLLGLVAGIQLQRALGSGRLARYLAESRVEYLVQVGSLGGDDEPSITASGAGGDVASGDYETAALRFRSELTGALSDPVEVRRQDEVYRERAPDQRDSVIVWRMGGGLRPVPPARRP